jgi:hypothetical protein
MLTATATTADAKCFTPDAAQTTPGQTAQELGPELLDLTVADDHKLIVSDAHEGTEGRH